MGDNGEQVSTETELGNGLSNLDKLVINHGDEKVAKG